MDEDSNTKLLLFTNAPDREVAMRIARALVDARLAACVNVLSGCTSVYRWDGVVETAEEVPMIIKTRAGRYDEVEAAIRSLHPYELPEILTVPVVHGLSEYLEWVAEETAIPIG
jgi:periplasmic divalent cation tolerance protein